MSTTPGTRAAGNGVRHSSRGPARRERDFGSEPITEDHPAGPYFRDRLRLVREAVTASLRREWGDRLPSGLTPEEAAPLVIAIMDGLQFQWLHEPDTFDMPAAFRAFVRLLDPEDDK